MTFLAQLGLMFLGVLFVLWLRAVWSARAAGDTWDWQYFIGTNAARFVLSAIGVVILGTAAYNDAAGVQSILEKFGTGIQLGSGFAAGSVIAAFVLIVPATGKSALVLILIPSLLLTAACPKASIEKAKSNSKRVATYSNAIVDITRELYRAGKISLEKKDELADKYIAIATAGQAFDATVASIEAQYAGSSVPKTELQKLFATFNREVVSAVIDALKLLKVPIPGMNNPDFWDKVELLKTAVLTIAGLVGQRGNVAAQFSAAGV